MAAKDNTFEFPKVLGNVDSAEAVQRQFLQAPMAAARGPATDTAMDVLKFMSAIPDALIASQKRELSRLTRVRKENDPAVARMEASLERAAQMKTMVTLGTARLQRVLAVVGDWSPAFHGFVSDASMRPLPGLTVRVSAGDASRGGSPLTVTTAEDGYFVIRFDNVRTQPTAAAPAAGAAPAGGPSSAPPATNDTTTSKDDASGTKGAVVEVLDSRANVLYRDPTPLPMGGSGLVYREYVVDSGVNAPPASDKPVK